MANRKDTLSLADMGAAAKGNNSDITQLSGITPGATLVANTNGQEKAVKLTSDDPYGVGFSVENTNGGAAVLHNLSKGPGGAATPDGSLTGGYGARPWDGSAYSEHSAAAIHFMQDGVCSPTNHGAWIRFMVTARNKTHASRFQALTISNKGDLITGNGVPDGTKNIPYLGGDLDGRGYKQINHEASEIVAFADSPTAVATSVNFRGVPLGGYYAAPGNTKTSSTVYLSMSTYDGANVQAASAAVALIATSDHTQTSRPTVIRFSTTASNETTRQDRWEIRSNILTPVVDGVATLGGPSTRVSAVYAVNGAIQTSDATLKTEVRSFSDSEIEAAKSLAKEIGFFSWLAKVELEGTDAREDCGMTVQRAIAIMESFGLDPFRYSFICYDRWDAHEVVDHYDEEEKPIFRTVPAGERYSFRVDQLNLLIARGFEARLSALEALMS